VDLANLPPPRVVIVDGIVAATTLALAADMRRESLVVEVATADLLRAPPGASVYVFRFDAATGLALAADIVAWATGAKPPPGLLGVIDGGEQADREELLAAGFDDGIAGPPSARELAARVRAVHRRVHGRSRESSPRLRFGVVTIDTAGHALWVDGQVVPLTAIELAVARALVSAHGRAMSRAELIDAAWGDDELEIGERAVDNVVLRLRRKLPRPDVVETVRGVGFRIARS
jgi:DNA-binding response OmpR family regulator